MKINEAIENFLYERINKVLESILENEKDRIYKSIEEKIKSEIVDCGIDFLEIIKSDLSGHDNLFLKISIDDRRKKNE